MYVWGQFCIPLWLVATVDCTIEPFLASVLLEEASAAYNVFIAQFLERQAAMILESRLLSQPDLGSVAVHTTFEDMCAWNSPELD